MADVFQWEGYCPICQKATTFRAENAWLRDHLHCMSCPRGSIPRERAMKVVLDRLVPRWRECAIHESSPADRGLSLILKDECRGYVASQFFPNGTPGSLYNGYRCEDLERQTFASETFDVVITQDVMEHVFQPDAAYREMYRTLRAGGLHIHTTPIYKDKVTSERRAARENGKIIHLVDPPEYHGNPIDAAGSLVTFHYGYDLPDLIQSWAGFDVEVVRFNDRRHGIVGEFTEVIVCRRPASIG
jgi:SAM-dependent methyltransferase